MALPKPVFPADASRFCLPCGGGHKLPLDARRRFYPMLAGCARGEFQGSGTTACRATGAIGKAASVSPGCRLELRTARVPLAHAPTAEVRPSRAQKRSSDGSRRNVRPLASYASAPETGALHRQLGDTPQGGGHGYEGLLVDNYHALLAVLDDMKAQ